MSTTICPHTKPIQLIFSPPFLEKDRTFLPLLSKCSPSCTHSLFSPHFFNFPVNLLHFTSKLSSIHHRAYLLSPPSKLSLYNPSYFSLFFSIVGLQTCFTSLSFLHFPASALHTVVPPLDPAAPSLCGPSSCVSVWCVCLWSFCSTVRPVDRKHPVHHHSQLPVGSAGSGGPICVISCQITEVWLCRISPTPNRLPGEGVCGEGRGKVPVGTALRWLLYPQGRQCHGRLSRDGSASLLRKDRGGPCLRWDV